MADNNAVLHAHYNATSIASFRCCKLTTALQAPSAASLLQCCKFATLELAVMLQLTATLHLATLELAAVLQLVAVQACNVVARSDANTHGNAVSSRHCSTTMASNAMLLCSNGNHRCRNFCFFFDGSFKSLQLRVFARELEKEKRRGEEV